MSIHRRTAYASGNEDAFNIVREGIRLSDYEFFFTSKSKVDFMQDVVYTELVGFTHGNNR